MQALAYLTGKSGSYGAEVEVTENGRVDGADNRLVILVDGLEREVALYVNDEDASVMMKFTDINGTEWDICLGAVSVGV